MPNRLHFRVRALPGHLPWDGVRIACAHGMPCAAESKFSLTPEKRSAGPDALGCMRGIVWAVLAEIAAALCICGIWRLWTIR